MPRRIDGDALLDVYGEWLYWLIPLDDPKDYDPDGDKRTRKAGKVPIRTDWLKIPTERRAKQIALIDVANELAEHLNEAGNIGLAIPPGMVCLDVDQKPDQYEMAASIDAARRAIREHRCPWAESGRDGVGLHLWFSVPPGARIAAETGKELEDDVRADVRSAGASQVVVWPSVHGATKRRYRWRRPLPPYPAQPPPLPKPWADALLEDAYTFDYRDSGTWLTKRDGAQPRHLCTYHFHMTALIRHPDGSVVRECSVNPPDNPADVQSFLLDGEALASPQKMKTAMRRFRGVVWRGDAEDLDLMGWHERRLPEYMLCDHHGVLDGSELIATRHHVYFKGDAIPVDGAGRAIVPGVFAVQLEGAGEDGSLDTLPALDATGDVSDVARLLAAVGNVWKFRGWLALAWSACAPVARWFRKRPGGIYPILWISGEWGSGKTTLADVARGIWGMPMGSGMQSGRVTAAGLERVMSRDSGLPLFLDDLRPDEAAKHLNTLLGAAGGRGGTQALRDSRAKVNQPMARAVPMGVSETEPRDDAFRSRGVVLRLSRSQHVDDAEASIAEAFALGPKVGHVLASLLTDGGFDGIVRRAREWDETLRRAGVQETRIRRDVWATMCAALDWLLELAEHELRDDALSMAQTLALESQQEARESDWCAHFMADVAAMCGNPQMTHVRQLVRVDDAEGVVWFALNPLVAEWAKWRRAQGHETWISAGELREYLKGKSYTWRAADGEYRRSVRLNHGERNRWCYGVKLVDAAPEGARELEQLLGVEIPNFMGDEE